MGQVRSERESMIAARNDPNNSEVPIRDLSVHDSREHLRAQYLLQGNTHDVAVKHDKVRREPRREASTRVLSERRVCRVARHAPQSLRARQSLLGVPVG